VLIFGFLSLTALLTSYVRPEYFLAFLFFAFLSLLFLFMKKQAKWLYINIFVLSVIAILLIATIGFPLGAGSGRSFCAFKQHFSLNWVEWTQSDLNPWTDSDQIVHGCFGAVGSTMQCVFSKPLLVIRHIRTNIISWPGNTKDLFLYPSQHGAPNLRYARLLGIYFLTLIAFVFLALARFSASNLKVVWRQTSFLAAVTALLVVPSFLSSILIYPRDHYLLLFAVPFFAVCLVLTRECSFRLKRGVSLATIAIGIYFLLQTSVYLEPVKDLRTKTTIEFLDSLGLTQNMHLLEAEGGFHFYLSSNWRRVPEDRKAEPFSLFILKHDINAIMLTESLSNDSRFRYDVEWLAFLSNFERFGFVRYVVPGTTRFFFLRNSFAGDHGEECESKSFVAHPL